MLMVNIGSLSTGGRVLALKDDLAKIQLTNQDTNLAGTLKHYLIIKNKIFY